MKYSKQNPPLVCMMTNSTNYKNGDYAKPVGILVHSTGANNPNIRRYVQPSTNDPKYNELMRLLGTNTGRNSWNQQTVWAGVNGWIGKLADGTITSAQTLPWNMSPWGCASGWNGSCNLYNGMHWIQYEICEDSLTDKSYFEATYKEACELTAYLCQLYNIDPHSTIKCGSVNVPTILCHKDSYNYGMGSNHADVYHWWNRYGRTMDDFRNDVAKLLSGSTSAPSTQESTSTTTAPTTTATIYRVRKTWADDKSQIGAYKDLNNAKALCDKNPGYSVFDDKGNAVYTKAAVSAPVKEQIYRIRKTWADSKSQIGAYKNLDAAKEHCAKNPGYSVFDESGNAVYTAQVVSKAGDVKYQVYANGKWWSYITNYGSGDDGYAGVIGYPMNALRAYVSGSANEVGYLEYRVHKMNGSWYPWQRDEEKDSSGDNFAGDLKNKFDGLQMRVVGVNGRHVKYRVHAIGKGWLDWITDYGDGSNGYAGWYGYAIDGVQVDIV